MNMLMGIEAGVIPSHDGRKLLMILTVLSVLLTYFMLKYKM